jgi:hypothetical protein
MALTPEQRQHLATEAARDQVRSQIRIAQMPVSEEFRLRQRRAAAVAREHAYAEIKRTIDEASNLAAVAEEMHFSSVEIAGYLSDGS